MKINYYEQNAHKREALQREINKRKVNIDRTVFSKTEKEKKEVKHYKIQNSDHKKRDELIESFIQYSKRSDFKTKYNVSIIIK